VLPATWRWRRNHVVPGPRDATLGYFHLRHRRGTVFTSEPWCAASQQLLRAKSGDNRELVGVKVPWT